MADKAIGRIAHGKWIHLALTASERQSYDRRMVLKRFLSKWPPLAAMMHLRWRVAVIAILVVIVFMTGITALAVRSRGAVGRAFEIVYTRPMHAVHKVPARILPWILPQAVQGGPGQARVQIPTDFYDFGPVGAREVVRRDFLIINQGTAPLVILQAYTTCGCTSAELTATIIPPGKASRVTVTFDAGFHPVAGQTVRRGLVLETNDPGRQEVEIWVQASVGTK